MLSIILYNCIVVYISKNSLWFPPFSLLTPLPGLRGNGQ